MDQKSRKIVDDAIRKFGEDDFWNNFSETLYADTTNREGIINELIEILKQAGYKFVVKPL